MITLGIIITLAGLFGLIYCIIKAITAKKNGLQGAELAQHLKRLIPINLASLFASSIGLGLITISILF